MRRLICILAISACLAGCGNPYALNIGDINFEAAQKPGVIQFTDPKLFKRAALLNERRNEQNFLLGLRTASEKPDFDFTPEIAREIEVIRAVSASAGLQFDPASGANYRRTTEVADMQQELELTRLQMQLAQLRRDAELQQKLLDQQTELSSEPRQLAAGSPAPVTSSLTEVNTQEALNQVNSLIDKLVTRLQANVPAPRSSSGLVGPIDKFNDLAAYRSVLKSALNAVSLDELHDKNGNSLFRLQLKATVLPDPPSYLDTLGVLRMEIVPPKMDSAAVSNLYWEWLMYVNRNLNQVPDPISNLPERRIGTSPQLVTLGDAGGQFDILRLELPKEGIQAAPPCGGLTIAESRTDACWYVRVAVPSLADAKLRPATLIDLAQSPEELIGLLRGAQQSVATNRGIPDPNKPDDVRKLAADTFLLDTTTCQPKSSNVALLRTDHPKRPGLNLGQAIVLARSARSWWPYQAAVLGQLSELYLGSDAAATDLSRRLRGVLGTMREANDAAGAFLVTLTDMNPDCREKLLAAASIQVPQAFADAIVTLQRTARVSVYDVVPAERVQRISTAARAADAVAFAAAVAGKLPSYGLGLNGNFAYSRSATGKADATERAPLVVGFTEPGTLGHAVLGPLKPNEENPTAVTALVKRQNVIAAFGWLLGPQISVDPKNQALVLTQRLRPYDLYADLSLPGWWPSFELLAYTAWAPNWRTVISSATAEVRSNALVRRVHVPMSHNAADMDGLTTALVTQLTGDRVALPTIQSVEPNQLPVCGPEVQVQVRGENIWRATMVHIGGLIVPETAIVVLPDMRGIIFPLQSRNIPIVQSNSNVVTVWTQDGPASFPISFQGQRPVGGQCKTDGMAASEEKPSKKPTIARVKPEEISVCDDKALLTLTGTNLGGATEATLGTMKTTMLTELPPKDGTILEVVFDKIDGKKKIGGMTALDLVLRTKDGTADGKINVKQSVCP